jgi:hypothetical protein
MLRKPLIAATAAVLGLVLWAAPPEPTEAFGTTNSAGQKQEHAEITRLALKDAGFGVQTLWVLGGGREPGRSSGPEKYGAVGAADRFDRGLVLKSNAHCDNGDWLNRPGYPRDAAVARQTLETCRTWILDQMDLAIAAADDILDAQGRIRPDQAPPVQDCRFRGRAKAPARCRVLEHLGLALHASQDFYSHSNWTDVASATDRVPGLARIGPTPWLQSRDTAFPTGLITGCFQFVPEGWFCRGRVRHEDLSKDKGDVGQPNGRTPRGADGNFGRAVSAAVDDSRGRWTALSAGIARRHSPQEAELILCVIRADDPAGCVAP